MKRLLILLGLGLVLSVLLAAGVNAQPPANPPVNQTNQTGEGPSGEPPGIGIAQKVLRIPGQVLNWVFGSLLAGIFG